MTVVEGINLVLLIFATVGGGLVLWIALKGKVLKEKNELGNKADDRLITILQTTVANLEKEVEALRRVVEETSKKLIEVQAENNVLREVFQGRDQNTIEFQKRGFEAIAKTDEVLRLARETNTLSQSTEKHLVKLLTLIEKHMKVIEKK